MLALTGILSKTPSHQASPQAIVGEPEKGTPGELLPSRPGNHCRLAPGDEQRLPAVAEVAVAATISGCMHSR
jgi:hypothetical protein